MGMTLYPGQTSQSSFLSNRIVGPTSVDETLESDARIKEATANATRAVFDTTYNERAGETLPSRISKYLQAGFIDTTDTIASVLPGIERGDIWEGAAEIGLDGLEEFRARNKSGTELTSAVMTGLAGGVFAESVILGRVGMSLASKVGLTESRLFRAGAELMPKARAAALAAQENAAIQGAFVNNIYTNSAMRGLMTSTALKNLGHAATAEATIAYLGQNNEAMWSESTAENMFWIGLGLAVPAFAGVIQGRAELRALANMPSITEMRRQAMDPHNFAYMRDQIADPSVPFDPSKVYVESADVVQSAIEARQVIPSNASKELKDRLSALQVQNQVTLQGKTAKFAAKGLPDVPSGRVISFNDKSPDRPLRDHIMDAQKQDPFLFMEASNIGTSNSIRGYMQSRKQTIDKLLKSVIPEDQIAAKAMQKKQPMVLIDKRLYPATKDALDLDRFDPKNVVLTPTTNVSGVYDYKVKLDSGRIVKLGLNFKELKLESAPIADRMGMIEGMRKLSATMRRAGKTQPSYVVPKDADWTQIEFGLYHGKQNGKVDVTQLGVKDPSELRFLALQKKIGVMKQNKDWDVYLDNWTRQKYNLPEASALERIEDGSSRAINTVLKAVDSGQVKTWDEVNGLYNEILARHELASRTQLAERTFEGNMWKFNRSQTDEWYKPVIVEYEQKQMDMSRRGTLDQHAEEIAANKLIKYHTLTRGGKDPNSLVTQVTALIHATPEGQKAVHVGGLADDQVTGLGQGIQAEIGSMLPNTFRARDSETIQAVTKLSQQVDDLALAKTKVEVQAVNAIAQKLNSYAAKSSRTLFDAFTSFRPGWDLLDDVVREDGVYKFVLNHKSAWNAKRLGREVQEGEYLKGPNGQILALDDLAMEAHTARSRLYNNKRLEENKIRRTMGLPEIRRQPHWVHSESVKGKYVAFVIDKEGKVVPGKTIVAGSPEEFERRRVEAYQNLGKNEHLHTQHEIEQTQDLYDSAQQHFVDAAFVGRTNVSNRGGLAGNVVRQDTFGEFLKYLQDKNSHLAKATVRTVLDDQIQIARARRVVDRNAYGAATRLMSSVAKEHKPTTIWDDYLRAAVGQQMGDVPLRATTKLLNSTEGYLQVFATGAWQGVRAMPTEQLANWTKDMLNRLGVPTSVLKTSKQSFDELTTALGPYMPYAGVQDFVNQTVKGGTPPEIRSMASKLNRWDATWRLRYFEIPNAAMNMLGIINNMPSILRASNVPVIGQLVNPTGKRVNIVDSMKILMQGTTETLKKTHAADWAYAKKHGGLKPGVAEIRELVAGIEDRSTLMRFLHGDKSLPASDKNIGTKIRRLGLDGVLAVANDTTEEWSRMWAHGIGLKLADFNGITGEAARFNFANSIADAAIANYSPRNRGELYHTALGSMMGLYQTYAMNYGNRMFRWAEKGEYTAIARQMATQSMFFGASSNVGFDQLEWLEDKTTRDEATITDMIYARFGPMVGSTIANGGIAQISQLLGADTGIALYNRADTNIRTNIVQDGVWMDPSKLAPALGTIKQVTEGMMEIGKSLWGDDRITTGRHISELVATYMPNRALKGAITVGFNDGMDIDRYGAVVTETKGTFEGILRFMGLRSTRQQDEVNFKYANQASLDKTAAQMEALREDTRSAFRDGRGDLIPEIWERYQELGMSPTQFKSWIRQQVEAANNTRSQRELMRGLNSPRMQAIIARQGWVD